MNPIAYSFTRNPLHRLRVVALRNLRNLSRPVCASLCLLASAWSASAATYYVSTTGNDTNPGTIDLPFRTIQKGANTEVAGDTLYIRGGVYYEGTVFVGHFSGTAAAPITVAAYPGETPIIDGNNYFLPNTTIAGTDPVTGNTYVWNPLLHISGSYHNVSGLEIRYSHGRGITIIGDHNQVSACNVHDNRQEGILVSGASNITVTNCSVSGAGNFAPYERAGGSPPWPGALACAASAPSTNVLIQGCTVFNNWAEGIGPYSASNVTIQDCVVYDNFAAEIYLEHTRFATVQRNLVYGTNTAPWLRNGMPCTGILIGDESFNTNPLGTDYTIVNNFVKGCARDITFWNGGATGTGLKNTLIAYNTLADSYDATKGCLDIAAGSHSNTLIENNIVRQTDTSLPVVTTEQNPGLTFSTNLWSRAVSGIQSSPSDVIGDPQLAQTGLTGPGQLLPDWFKLLSTSPARNAGVVSAIVTEDFFRTARSSTPCIGGHEFVATTPPATPTGLTATAGNAQVSLSWNASSGATSYNVKRATVSGGPYSTIASPTTTNYTDTGLTNGTTYYYVVSAVNSYGESANSGQVSATPQANVTIIKDDADATGITKVGTWTSSTTAQGYYGTDYLHDGNTGSTGGKSVTFTPTIGTAGNYAVYVRWTAAWNRSTITPIDVNYAGGLQDTQYVDQTVNNNVWVLLGTYAFDAGTTGNVTIRNDGADGYVIADAVKFVQQ